MYESSSWLVFTGASTEGLWWLSLTVRASPGGVSGHQLMSTSGFGFFPEQGGRTNTHTHLGNNIHNS